MPALEKPKPLRLLLVGATGVVGRHVLKLALADCRIDKIVAVTRCALSPQSKLENPILNFSELSIDAPYWKVDAVICTLGTTMRAAGSHTAFATVDRDYPIQIAKIARQAGATHFALSSTLGSSQNGNFYLRTKAEAEAGIKMLDYPGYTIVRPSLIDTARNDSRPAETIGLLFLRLLHPLIPRRYRAVKPERIASALLEAVLLNQSGVHIIESEHL